MASIIRIKKIFRILLFCLIAILGSGNLTLASEQSDIDETVDEFAARMYDLGLGINGEKKFDEAFKLINQFKIQNHLIIYQMKGHLLASGKLSTGRDTCGAIANYEKMYVEWGWVRDLLDHLYGGDWPSIAAVEGNRQALFELGIRNLNMPKNTPIILFYNDTLAIKEAYKYFYNAAELRYLKAEKKLAELVKRYPDFDFTKYQIKMQFTKVHCNVRKYQSAE